MNKELIRARFAKSLNSYHSNARIQKRMAERLFSFIANKAPKKILEIGCGTGFLTEIINNNLNYEEYTAIDIVKECQSYIKKFNSEIKFIPADIEDFLNTNSNKYDLIVSNASLQWVNSFEAIVKELKARLNPNGELVFSTFSNENFREIYHITGKTLNYFSINELMAMFPNSIIEPEIHIMAFNTPKDVLRHLQQTGVNGIENTLWTKKDLNKFENGYKNFCSGKPTLTYNPVYIKIK